MTDMPSAPAQSVTAGPAIFIVNLGDNFLTERPQHCAWKAFAICHLLFVIRPEGPGSASLTSRPLLFQKLIDIRGSDHVDACIKDGGHSLPLSQIVQDFDAFDTHCVRPLTDESVAFALF